MATDPQGNPGTPRFGPSDCLIAMFRACSRDPTQAVKERLRRMLHTFLQHDSGDAGNRKSKELCCYEAGIWYYRILENHLMQERRRLGISDISGLLENNLVQCCLVACCLEISVCLNRLSCNFPQLLQILDIAPYHFWKVIELVLRTEVGLPRSAVNHLTQLDVKVLESLAWTSDSPLWEDIRANEGHLPTCQQVVPPTQLEDPKRTEIHQGGVSLGADASTSPDPPCSSSDANRPRRSRPLHLFTRKVYSLMGGRLRELCSALHICDELRLKIWTCFEHSLVQYTGLMEDRHLDQLLMCSIYIMAKITKIELPFKGIMKCYKSQPHTNKSVCKNVLISKKDGDASTERSRGDPSNTFLTPDTPSAHYPTPCREERGNLIHFYNQVYTMKLQHFAKQFSPTSGGDTPPLSPYPQQRKASPRGRRLTCSHPIFVSLHKPKANPPPTTGLLYIFNSSSSERLREINNMIKTGRASTKRSHAASSEQSEEAADDGPAARRLRRGDQSVLHRRLRNVVNDRITRRNLEPDPPVVEL